jgi:glycosyltransferase involved in cell wall biosynthesis
LSDRRPRIACTSRFEAELAGGIEACVSEIVPRLRLLRPEWNVRAVHAFGRSSKLGRIPLVCDLVAGIVLAARTRRDDVVIVNGAEYAFVRMLLPNWRRTTIVVWHGTRAGEIPALAPRMTFAIRVYAWAELFLQRLAFAAPRQIAVGDAVRSELLGAYGFAPQIEVVPNGVRPNQRIRVEDGRTQSSASVLWVGSNAFKKGLDIALEACRLARRALPDLRLVVAGLENARVREPWIVDEGVVSRERMAELLEDADVVLATTRYEACSMAILEAMAHGKPIVASRPVAWMFGDGGTAPDTVPAFAEALLTSLTPRGRAEGQARSLRALTRFDWDVAAAAYVRAVERLL